MIPAEILESLDVDAALLKRACREGLLVGKGEGFVSREWRGASGLVLAAHLDENENALACVVPLPALMPSSVWTVSALLRDEQCVHCARVRLESEGLTLWARLPDHAARRGLWPIGLEARVWLGLLVQRWSPASGAESVSGTEEGRLRVTGKVQTSEMSGVELVSGSLRLGLAGGAAQEGVPGESLEVEGMLVARIGAPVRRREPPVSP